MRVKVTLQNILEYGLDVITGNTREDLLARSAEMHHSGNELFVNIPDVEGGDNDIPKERNIFEHYKTDLPDPDGFAHTHESTNLVGIEQFQCGYRYREVELGEYKWVCNLHNVPSKHFVDMDSHDPCLVMDPYGHDWEY